MTTDIDYKLNENLNYDILKSEYLWDIVKEANNSEKWELISVVKESQDNYTGVFRRRNNHAKKLGQ